MRFRRPRIPPMLSRRPTQRENFEQRIRIAHQLFAQGQFLESAAQFEELALIAENRNGPRAPRFYLQAGRALMYAGQTERGMILLEKGRTMMLSGTQKDLLPIILQRISSELQELGLLKQAELVASWINQNQLRPTGQAPALHKHLPSLCPFCGGPVHPEEVEWFENGTAECEYCGTILQEPPD